MAFPTLKLGSSLHGRQIKSIAEATAFVENLDLSRQNLRHWQMARQALHNAAISDRVEDLAWREFRDALDIEGWLPN
jgi:hypothetical protein